MLIRILSSNPGKTFTRNIDVKFVQTVKELLRVGRDPSVKQILMETLDTFSRENAGDEGLAPLNEMWKKEHEKMVKIHVCSHPQCRINQLNGRQGPQARNPGAMAYNSGSNDQNYFSRNHHSRRLPAPHELSSRIEEARTSAGLLSQVVQSTPPSELLSNDLVREFADRCQSASRSIQAYMVAENPSPDNDTMETLIETNEQLGKAMSQHQRAVLSARKAAGLGNGSPSPSPSAAAFSPPAGPPPNRTGSGFAAPPGPPPSQTKPQTRKSVPKIPPPGDYAPTGSDDENPFSDPKLPIASASTTHNPPFPKDKEPQNTGQFNDRLGIEPYHPGFNPTPSYVGRQDSSLGKVTMHAAVPETPDEEEGERQRSKEPVYRY